MKLEQAINQIQKAIAAAEARKNIEHFDDQKNIKEMLGDIEFRLNPPVKTERKV